MKIWFIRHNDETLGPYTNDELISLGVRGDDYVWKDGLIEWVKAKTRKDLILQGINQKPPPFIDPEHKVNHNKSEYYVNSESSQNPSRAKEQDKRIGRILRLIGVMGILAIVVYFFILKSQTKNLFLPAEYQKTPLELKQDLSLLERKNPGQYLSARASRRKNIIGETILEGTIKNSATLVVYKDVILEVDFLSKTNSIISTKRFTVYELVGPGKTANFKIKTIVPRDAKGFDFSILNASSAN